MTLLKSTQTALDFTRRLQSALTLDDLDLSREILELRAQAMQAFERCHRSATPEERANCRDEIRALVQADRELQEKTSTDLAAIARDFREKMVSNLQNPAQSYCSGPTQACIDRKV